jgi:hypothetical protein
VTVATVDLPPPRVTRCSMATLGGRPVIRSTSGFLELLDELPRVRRHAVEEPPLAFGKEDIEGEGRFAGAAEAGDDDHLVARDRERNVLEVVLAGAADFDAIGAQGVGSRGLGHHREFRRFVHVERTAFVAGPLQDSAEIAPGMRGLDRRDFLRGARGDDKTAGVARFRAEVDHVVGALDDVEVVLDDDEGIPLRDEALENFYQQRDVVEMEAGGRLVKNEEAVLGALVGEMADELEALGFAAGEDIERLAEAEIAEADLLEDAQRLDNLLAKARAGAAGVPCLDGLRAKGGEELDGLRDGGIEHVVDRFAVDFYFEHMRLVALAVALRAADEDVAEELHFDLLEAVAGAAVATALAGIEGERAGGEPGLGGLGLLGKEFADGIERAEINGGAGARSAGEGRLIDEDDALDALGADELSAAAHSGFIRAEAALGLEILVEHIVDERALAGAGDAGDAGEKAERETDVDLAEVVLGGAFDLEPVFRRAALLWERGSICARRGNRR